MGMGYVVLGAWLIQATVGVTLLVSWARHAHQQSAGLVWTHAVAMVGFLVPWFAFIVTGDPLWTWVGFGVLVVFIGFGDATMVRRARTVLGWMNRGLRDYIPAGRVALSGRLGRRTTFHMLFSAVVFFGALAVAIGSTVAAATL